MDNDGIRARELRDNLRALVAVIISEYSPKDDELSMAAAYRDYGRSWVNRQVENGNLEVRFKETGRKVLSRADIESLKAVETPYVKINVKGLTSALGMMPEKETRRDDDAYVIIRPNRNRSRK